MTTENTSLEAMLDASEHVETSAPAPVESAPPETGDKPSAAPPADASAQAEPRDDAPHVPRKALEDERKKRQELERRLADLERSAQPQQRQPQQQEQAPQITSEELERLWWENPAQAAAIVQHIAAQNAVVHAERMMMSRELDRSERRQRKAHGDETVTAALQQAKQAGMIQSFLNEDDPYQSLMDWHKEVEAVRDPKSLKEKLRAELMAEMGINPAAPKPTAQAAVPKSLASRTSAQPRASNGQFQERASLDDILG
jgi:hypothetical protein